MDIGGALIAEMSVSGRLSLKIHLTLSKGCGGVSI